MPFTASWPHTIFKFVVESANQWDCLVSSVVHVVYLLHPLSLVPAVSHTLCLSRPLSLVSSCPLSLHAIFPLIAGSVDQCALLVPSLASSDTIGMSGKYPSFVSTSKSDMLKKQDTAGCVPVPMALMSL